MAAISPMNSFSSGSLASRPVRQIPSSKRRGTAQGDAAPAAAPMAVAPTRRDNILAARADGTFGAKRDAYNRAGQTTGHSMDEAGNITAPPPAAIKPGGKLIPGHSPGSSIWQPDSPASQSGQPGQSSPPTALPPTLKRPTAPRPTGGLIDGKPAAQALSDLKTAQSQVPRQTARNSEVQPAVQLPTVASAMKPAVTNNVTRNVTSPVTPESQGPAAKALADFNAKNPGVITGAAGIAQTDTLAAERRGAFQGAANEAQTHIKSILSTAQKPTTTTPSGVPAASTDFNAQQTDNYNTAMAFLASAPASPPTVNPATPAAPATTASPTAPVAATTAPVPGKQRVAAAASATAGVIGGAVTLPGKLATAPLSAVQQNAPALRQAAGEQIPTAALLPGKMAVAPLLAAKRGGQIAGSGASDTGSAVKDLGKQARNWWETGSARPTPAFDAKTIATKPAVNPSKVGFGL